MGLLAYLIAGIVLVGALVGGYVKIHHDGVVAGRAEIQVQWDAANRKAADEQKAREVAAKLIADTSAAELAAAQQKGAAYEAKWRVERAKHRDSTLAGCSGSPTANATGGQATLPLPSGSDAPVRFSAGFLRLWDSAWTDDAGQPVFRDQPAPQVGTPDPPDALTAIGPGEVLDNHQANAESCSRDRRKLDSLIDQVEKLRAGWK